MQYFKDMFLLAEEDISCDEKVEALLNATDSGALLSSPSQFSITYGELLRKYSLFPLFQLLNVALHRKNTCYYLLPLGNSHIHLLLGYETPICMDAQ